MRYLYGRQDHGFAVDQARSSDSEYFQDSTFSRMNIMQDAVKSIENVTHEIDALKSIVDAAVPKAPLVAAALHVALEALATQGALPTPTGPMNTKQSLAGNKPPSRPRPRDPLDGLGGGKILD
ncbi:hypothetical protein GIW70_05835 [Pseudomonas syringae]|nr:hypothetical protein [Pseudomonas syringae]MCF5067717.1 hypothetical protein [Pseudomonas syringae]